MAFVNITLATNIRQLAGVGDKRAESFARLGIYTVEDLLMHFPRKYQHRGDVLALKDARLDEYASYILTVGTEPKTVTVKNRIQLTKFSAFDESGKCGLVFFNAPYVKDIFRKGTTFRFWGKITKSNGYLVMTAPAYEPCLDETGRDLPEFVPLYPLTEGLTQKFISNQVKIALSLLKIDCAEDYDYSAAAEGAEAAPPPELPKALQAMELLPADMVKKYRLCSRAYAIKAVHNPTSYEVLERGRQRLMFEELFIFALGIGLLKKRRRTAVAAEMQLQSGQLQRFLEALPFALTGAQERVVNDICKDLTNRNRVPMNRIIIGDVGSGKTVCAAAAAFVAAQNGLQTALMVPTEILAEQHYKDLAPLFRSLGICTALLTGGLKAAEKKQARNSLATGEADVVIGTHALISGDTEFAKLGLVITDEQHRFGIMQRAELSKRSEQDGVHTLVMSATPIPRTLALTMFGDLNLSVIDELPPGRQKVDTFVVNEGYRTRLEGFILKQKAEGHQTYIVCPSIEAKEEGDPEASGGIEVPSRTDGDGQQQFSFEAQKEETPPLKNAAEYAETLAARYPQLRVDLVHGRMTAEQKNAVMSRFAAGESDVLVSTTVIEVGVNVPNATLMVIENAERFGLSQLHQLRGRVGRGKAKSWCILVSDSKAETAVKRLAVIKQNNDGYAIAREDLVLRGPGDFFRQRGNEWEKNGELRQHGSVKFKFAEMLADETLLQAVFVEAEAFLQAKTPEALMESTLYQAVEKMFALSDHILN